MKLPPAVGARSLGILINAQAALRENAVFCYPRRPCHPLEMKSEG